MKRFTVFFAAFLWMCTALLASSQLHAGEGSAGSQPSVDFAKDVFPLLRERCFDCHRGPNPQSGVRLDHHAKLLGETDGVPLVVPGASDRSRLIHVVSKAVDDRRMPPADAGQRLSDEQVELLRAWIDQGVKWDEELLPDPNRALAAKHWAFRPIERPPVPDVAALLAQKNRHLAQANGGVHPIDAFIGVKQNKLGLAAAGPASKRQLIRRLYLVLHGLPPSCEQMEQFLVDESSGAWGELVERVLKSDHYGERIARHWLDSARWAESEGFAQNNDRPFAWRYRDYVIDSFNRDKPYTEFLTQQIAGDELEPYSDENLIATGFLAAARISADDLHFYRAENDMYTDIVNTLSSSVLGLTIACSQCHDHKFDPISQRDFYRLQAFFSRGFPGNVVLADSPRPDELDGLARELLAFDLSVRNRVLAEGYDEAPRAIRELLHSSESQRSLEQERSYRPERIRLNIRIAGCNSFRIREDEKKRLDELRNKLNRLVGQASQTWGFYSPITSPHQLSTLPMAGNFPLLHDKKRLAERRTYLLARGQIFEPVAVVTPGWPAAFGPTHSAQLQSRPRTALAEWLTSRDNPLTARVWVNRVWQMHFGRGLVDTPGNFGVRGSTPTHPQLLDWLAAELMDHGWSTKHIHRLIVTSRTWQQSSQAGPVPADPENRYLWRWPRRRLEAEAIRDSMLTASGELDRTISGPAVAADQETTSARRGLYLFQKRDAPPAMQALFDGPTAMSEACVERQVSTSALQALYLLNNVFSHHRSRALAQRIQSQAGNDVERQIQSAFEIVLGRAPEDLEREAARAFFEQHTNRTRQQKNKADADPALTLRAAPPTEHLSLWLRADAGVSSASGEPAKDKDAVASWLDQAAGDNRWADELEQTTATRQPRFVSNPLQGIGGIPVVRFAGGPFGQADHFLAGADQHELHITNGYTLLAVVRFNGKGQRNEVVFMKARNGGNDVGVLGVIRLAASGKITIGQNIRGQWADRVESSRPVPDGVPVILVVRWDGSKLDLDIVNAGGTFTSDSTELKGTIDPGAGGQVSVGGYIDAFSDDGERLNGDLGELLFYRTALSDQQRDKTTSYLRQRWLKETTFGTPLELFAQAMLNVNEFLYIE